MFTFSIVRVFIVISILFQQKKIRIDGVEMHDFKQKNIRPLGSADLSGVSAPCADFHFGPCGPCFFLIFISYRDKKKFNDFEDSLDRFSGN